MGLSESSLRVARSPAPSPSQRKSSSKSPPESSDHSYSKKTADSAASASNSGMKIVKQLNDVLGCDVKPTVKELPSSVNNHEAALGIAAIRSPPNRRTSP